MSSPTYQRICYQDPASFLPADFIQNLPDIFEKEGTFIYNKRNQIKVFEHNGHLINVKRFCMPAVFNRIIYSYNIRAPKAVRAYQNAEKIIQHGFRTATPYGYLIEKQDGLIKYSYFVSEHIRQAQSVSYFCDDKEVICALARYTAELHQKGLMHRDYTPGNVVYKKEGDKWIFTLLDINRFFFWTRPIPAWMAGKNLMQPFHDPQRLRLFVSEYVAARGSSRLLIPYVLFLRRMRNLYSELKHSLKKLPFAQLFNQKPLNKNK